MLTKTYPPPPFPLPAGVVYEVHHRPDGTPGGWAIVHDRGHGVTTGTGGTGTPTREQWEAAIERLNITEDIN